MEAIRVYARYDLPNENKETRRERNERFGFNDSPKLEIPDCGEYLWELFTTLSNAIHRVDFNGYYYNLPPSDIIAWCKLTNTDITPREYDIISSMDRVFCSELNKDKNARDTKKYEEQKREMESKSKRRR